MHTFMHTAMCLHIREVTCTTHGLSSVALNPILYKFYLFSFFIFSAALYGLIVALVLTTKG